MYKYLQVLCASPWRSGSKSIQDWPKIFIFSSFPFLSLGRTSTTVTEKQNKNLFWNSKIIVVRYFRTMYLYQHFKNRAVSITSDFPHTHNCFDSTLPASLQLKLFISLFCNCINPVKTRSDQHLHVKKMIGLPPKGFWLLDKFLFSALSIRPSTCQNSGRTTLLWIVGCTLQGPSQNYRTKK